MQVPLRKAPHWPRSRIRNLQAMGPGCSTCRGGRAVQLILCLRTRWSFPFLFFFLSPRPASLRHSCIPLMTLAAIPFESHPGDSSGMFGGKLESCLLDLVQGLELLWRVRGT